MIVDLDATTIDGREFTLSIAPGSPTVIAVETDDLPLHLSLLLGGRLRPDAGRVLVDGTSDANALRRRTALVDTPIVAEPTAGVAVRTVIAEELAFAGRGARDQSVRSLLEEHGLEGRAGAAFGALPTADRIRLLAELALLRPGVEGLVLTSPERHGGDPEEWFPSIVAITARGVAVAIVTDAPTARLLINLGARDAADALPEPSPEEPAADAPDLIEGHTP